MGQAVNIIEKNHGPNVPNLALQIPPTCYPYESREEPALPVSGLTASTDYHAALSSLLSGTNIVFDGEKAT